MFAAVVLGYVTEITETLNLDGAEEIVLHTASAREIKDGIENYAYTKNAKGEKDLC